MAKIPRELAPYYEVCFILGFGICEHCSLEAEFSSAHRQFSDEWWLDEAAAMRSQGWVVSEQLVAYCARCSQTLGLRHDPDAHTCSAEDLL